MRGYPEEYIKYPKFRRWMEQHGWTVSGIAQILGVSKQTMYIYLTYPEKDMPLKHIQRLYELFDIDVGECFFKGRVARTRPKRKTNLTKWQEERRNEENNE